MIPYIDTSRGNAFFAVVIVQYQCHIRYFSIYLLQINRLVGIIWHRGKLKRKVEFHERDEPLCFKLFYDYTKQGIN